MEHITTHNLNESLCLVLPVVFHSQLLWYKITDKLVGTRLHLNQLDEPVNHREV